jgi:hypothetical protein
LVVAVNKDDEQPGGSPWTHRLRNVEADEPHKQKQPKQRKIDAMKGRKQLMWQNWTTTLNGFQTASTDCQVPTFYL